MHPASKKGFKIIFYFLSALTLASISWRVSPALRYAEGWSTFYYDKHFIAQEAGNGNIGSLVSSFFLQFFHVPSHGIVLMMLLFLLVEMLFVVVLNRIRKTVFSYVVSFVITVCLAITLMSNLGRVSFLSVLGMGDASNMRYMKYCNMAGDEDWDGVIGEWQSGGPEGNLLNQNIINMAMAEKGMLHEHLDDNPCADINSVYVSEIQSEYVAAMISDVYYSMGHIAQSQRYAFEANEKFDNCSPRLLQRLIKTNIIYGQYRVARKYLAKLSDAIYYKVWCQRYGKLLDDKAVEADRELSLKRKCLNIDNKFSGFGGLDKDLLQIARATKGTHQSRTTVQYLSALYRLARYKDEYESLINEFKLCR
ncbi:MAG: DUF6057 family protein [Prevotella sp.]|nr:DUF6057 family protein [Prevotella sp.]